MTPTQPLAALAVGTLLGLAAWMAPSQSPEGDPVQALACVTDCTGSAHDLPVVGATPEAGPIHLITRPGAYGLSTPPPGQQYAIVSGHIVRVDRDGGIIRSVLRPMPKVLD